MDIATTRSGEVATVALGGIIDMRAAGDFERALLDALAAGARHLVIDFERVELLTSAGIRVLVSVTRRVTGAGGGLVLCALNAGVQRVLDISGLTRQFRVAGTRAEALASLSAGPPPPRRSRVTLFVERLLGSGPSKAAAPAADQRGAPSQLASHVARLLGERDPQPK
jgi:anti-sigma B factor antagonist